MPAFPGGGRYRRLGPTWKDRFGEKVFKATLRGGFGCPNRDGRVGTGGCIFCSETALLPATGPVSGPVEKQLEAGLATAARRGAAKAVAYFQDQTATDAPLGILRDLYTRALRHPRVVALAVGTRPDWIGDDVLALLEELNREKPVFLELGLQSANDELLEVINRGHGVATFEQAVQSAHQAGLEVVAHVILDLPGETRDHRRATAACLNRTGVEGVKIHNLHVLRHTELAHWLERGELRLASLPDYARMAADFLQRLDSGMVIHRLSGEGPADAMLAPSWGRDKRRILAEVEKTLAGCDGWQGKTTEGDHER